MSNDWWAYKALFRSYKRLLYRLVLTGIWARKIMTGVITFLKMFCSSFTGVTYVVFYFF